MAAQRMSPPSDHEHGIRKRVGKACDRCRLKKSKCDGFSPCGRCRADNTICVMGERKKSHDKIYPKGYVEMLEQQQTQLVNGLQEMYKRITNNEGWKGEPLDTVARGYPLTHDILERLDVLGIDGHHSPDRFEEDTEILQGRFFDEGVLPAKRQATPDANDKEEGEEGEAPPKRHASRSKRSLTDSFLPRRSGGLPPPPSTQTPSSFGNASPARYDGTDPLLDPAQLHVPHQPWTWSPTTCGPAPGFVDNSLRPAFASNMYPHCQPNLCLPILSSSQDDEFGRSLTPGLYDMMLDTRAPLSFG